MRRGCARRAVCFVGWAGIVALGNASCGRGREPERPAPARPRPVIEQFPLPTSGSRPQGIAPGPDGAMWFTERSGNKIGRIATASPHTVSEYPLPTAASSPYAIVAGRDGNIWFTEDTGDRIGWIDPRAPGVVSELAIPTSKAWARAIVAGPDGNIWFAEQGGSRIGRVTVQAPQTIADFALPRFPTYPYGLTASADGYLWYAAAGETVGRVVAVFPEGIFEIPLRTKNANPSAIAVGSDGNLWVALARTGTLARVQPVSPYRVTELALPGEPGEAGGLCTSPGYLWLTRRGHNAITRIEIASPNRVREIPVPAKLGSPESVALGPDGNIWFTAPDGNSIGQLHVLALAGGQAAQEDQRVSVPAVLIAEYDPGPAPIPEGELDIRADANCTIQIDGVERFRIAAQDGRVISIGVGRHVVVAFAASGGARWERSVEVFSGLRAHAMVELSSVSRATGPAGAGPTAGLPLIEFVSIPSGEFVMGSEVGHPDERPAHRVRLSQPFQMSKYEVTQAQWAAVMGPIVADPSAGQFVSNRPRIRYMDLDERNPVVGVSWDDAQEFIAKLNALDNQHVYRLPTEAEWEYACRAGSTVDLPADIAEMAWIQDNFGLEFHAVGKKKPNGWGLYDIQGNAIEWVADWYDKDYYRRTPPTDPPGPLSGSKRLYRGGDAWNPASNCRCANRSGGGYLPGERATHAGFRLARQSR